MAKAVAMTIGVPGVEININYNDVNMRITSIDWTIATGYAGRCQIWNNDVSIYDETYGSGIGAANVPGSHYMVERLDDISGETVLVLPDYLTYALHIRTIG